MDILENHRGKLILNDIKKFFRIVRICLIQRRIVDNFDKPFIIESENRFQ